ncbi:N-acyl-D-glucosamine 2-epimerase [Bacillus sp. SA1-12]|nr:N-acyl-D-glucosamine 2-epimerase [Bacillus sp. SA1-12]
MREAALNGKSIQIDPGFAYYQGRSVESIADEIKLAGYKAVHYFVVNENNVNGDLIDAFHERGIAVWALVLGNGTYSTERFPKEWPDWQMELLQPLNDGYIRLSPHSEGYKAWKKQALANLVTEYPFDGIEIAEPYFPEWNGIERGVYGDVGPLAQQAFYDKYHQDIPDFVNEDSENYYLNNQSLYKKWIHFRVETVNHFLDEIINGENGVRSVRPDILVGTWSLAIDAGKDSLKRLKELQGLDAASMVDKVNPDIHFFQTHWPDWMRDQLPADYFLKYEPFVEQLRKKHPKLPIGIQADIGSFQYMIKGKEWLETFSNTAFSEGYATWTAYEYHLGGYIYHEKPVPLKAEKADDTEVMISFNKRIDPASVSLTESFFLDNGESSVPLEITDLKVDGNHVFISSPQLDSKEPIKVYVKGMKDTPELWLFKGYPANETPDGSYVWIK